MNQNFLHGSIPESMGGCLKLELVQLSENSLSSTIPSAFSTFKLLTSLNLSNNLLTGDIASLFTPAATFNLLVSVDLSSNRLSSSLSSISLPPHLQILSLEANCFSGTIPPEICSAKSLRILNLDSLSTGAACVNRAPPAMRWLVKGTFAERFLQGSIPSCIWAMQNLTTLHLAGNGLKGTIGDLHGYSQLSVADLSGNYLTGTVPLTIQTHGKFAQLALASNRLSGSLSSEFVLTNVTTLLNMHTNRLSGKLPPAFYCDFTVGMDVLSGNLFACAGDANAMPQQDASYHTYVCGSANLNDALIVWCVCVGLFLLLPLICFWLCVRGGLSAGAESTTSRTTEAVTTSTVIVAALASCCGCLATGRWCFSAAVHAMRDWWAVGTAILAYRAVPKSNASDELGLLAALVIQVQMQQLFCVAVFRVTSFLLCICMVCYYIMKTGSGGPSHTLYSQQYTWVLSSAYLHGLPAAAIVISLVGLVQLLAVALVAPVCQSPPLNRASQQQEQQQADGGQEEGIARLPTMKCLERLILCAVNFAVILVVNVGYVLAVLTGFNSTTLVLIQIALSVFKVAWREGFVLWALGRMHAHTDISPGAKTIYALTMLLFDFIIAPCLATLGADGDCLYDALAGYKPVTSTYNEVLLLFICENYVLGTNATEDLYTRCRFNPVPTVAEITVQPAWLYSYQCSSGEFAHT